MPSSLLSASPLPFPAVSGFGSVMEREHELHSSTGSQLDALNGPHAIAIDVILRHQQVRLGDNIALLERRYETLPHPGRFQALRKRFAPLTKARRVAEAPQSIGQLPDLVGQHLVLLENLMALIAQGPNGAFSEYLLGEMARHHEEMAWTLTTLLKRDESVRDMVPMPVVAAIERDATHLAPIVKIPASVIPGNAEGRWENEGGTPASPAALVSPDLPRAA